MYNKKPDYEFLRAIDGIVSAAIFTVILTASQIESHSFALKASIALSAWAFPFLVFGYVWAVSRLRDESSLDGKEYINYNIASKLEDIGLTFGILSLVMFFFSTGIIYGVIFSTSVFIIVWVGIKKIQP